MKPSLKLKSKTNRFAFQEKLQRNSHVLVISSIPPRECGIATFTNDLIDALERTFLQHLKISICALETDHEKHTYDGRIAMKLNPAHWESYMELLATIRNQENLDLVVVQHEFGFFRAEKEFFLAFLQHIQIPVVLAFHTVLPNPNDEQKRYLQKLASVVSKLVVMTKKSSAILENDYEISHKKIKIIAHGTHLTEHKDKHSLKQTYNLESKLVLATFGLLSEGKGIETTLRALPKLIENQPNILFLILGKTHPTIVLNEGEKYREHLENIVHELQISNHVQFVNKYIQLEELIDYLQLTDVYVFSSKDPHQAVSGTISYAMSCGCPIVSTPFPHAFELLDNEHYTFFEVNDSGRLTENIQFLLKNPEKLEQIRISQLQKMAETAWENVAISYVKLFQETIAMFQFPTYKHPPIHLNHLERMTTRVGMVQFSKINFPDLESGYTLDDNARAMIAVAQHAELYEDKNDFDLIHLYLDFIDFCMLEDGSFLNYVDKHEKFTQQNNETNLEDSNGRAIWALGFVISLHESLPRSIIHRAEKIFHRAMLPVQKICSTRSMAFILKGIYFYQLKHKNYAYQPIIKTFANRMVQMYRHESDENWCWFEHTMTYANSILPESLLFAYKMTQDETYLEIAKESFDFLLEKTFTKNHFKGISNQTWYERGNHHPLTEKGGEQPIDVAYTILALDAFYSVFHQKDYKEKLLLAFDWFLGRNSINQLVYNPKTGGCYDGLEQKNINLNQGAESLDSYLISRLLIEKKYATCNNETKIPRKKSFKFWRKPNSEQLLKKHKIKS